jgi:hypothetical protein
MGKLSVIETLILINSTGKPYQNLPNGIGTMKKFKNSEKKIGKEFKKKWKKEKTSIIQWEEVYEEDIDLEEEEDFVEIEMMKKKGRRKL